MYPSSGYPGSGWLTQRLRLDGGSPSMSQPVLDLRQTWSNPQHLYTGFRLSITNNGSNPVSPLIDVTSGLAGRLIFTSNGTINIAGTGHSLAAPVLGWVITCGNDGTSASNLIFGDAPASNFPASSVGNPRLNLSANGIKIGANSAFSWGNPGALGNTTLALWWDGNQTLNQRNGTNGQIARWSRTHTDASNYERVALDLSSNTFILRPEAAGTGTLRPLYIRTGATTVANLAPAASVGAGTICHVTDATATTLRSIVAGGGSNFVQVMSDGTNWLISA